MRSVLLYGGLIECEDIKHALFSYMVTTTYISDNEKIKLLKDTVNYIQTNMNRITLTESDPPETRSYINRGKFRNFKRAINNVSTTLKFPFSLTSVTKHAKTALELWNPIMKFVSQVEMIYLS